MPNLISLSLRLVSITLLALISSCAQQYTVSINNQAVFDPTDRLLSAETRDPNLQGCINIALLQQNVNDVANLSVLSCANAEINDLENIGQLAGLRFLDLGNNNISNITPLEDLSQLGGLNLMNNAIIDISPLFNIVSLASVSLLGNDGIPCDQLNTLAEKLGDNLTPPLGCNN